MIDVSKCTFEEKFETEEGETVYYFIYPAKEGMAETEFFTDEGEENIISTCLSLTVYFGGHYLQLSPTVMKDDMMSDTEFRDLYPGVNFTEDTVYQLIAKVGPLALDKRKP